MDLATVKDLVDYHYWANERILQAVEAAPDGTYHRELGGSFPSIAATLAHLIYAEAVWLGRWTGEALAAPTVDDLPTVTAARERWRSFAERLRPFVDGLSPEDLDQVQVIRTSSGKEFRHSLREMLLHLFNHGTYHRGQVVTMLRQAGAEAPSTDLIQYYRVRPGQL